MILPVESIIEKLKKLDALIDMHKNDEYRTIGGETELIGNEFRKMKQGAERLENYPLLQNTNRRLWRAFATRGGHGLG